MAMLHLLYNCLNGNKQAKKMFFKVHILYIDEGTVFGWSDERREANRRLIEDACIRYGFNLSTIYLESIFDIDLSTKNEAAPDMDAEIYTKSGSDLETEPHVFPVIDFVEKKARLESLINTLEASFAADLVFYFKKWLMADFCLKHHFKKVFLGTSGHKMSS